MQSAVPKARSFRCQGSKTLDQHGAFHPFWAISSLGGSGKAQRPAGSPFANLERLLEYGNHLFLSVVCAWDVVPGVTTFDPLLFLTSRCPAKGLQPVFSSDDFYLPASGISEFRPCIGRRTRLKLAEDVKGLLLGVPFSLHYVSQRATEFAVGLAPKQGEGRLNAHISPHVPPEWPAGCSVGVCPNWASGQGMKSVRSGLSRPSSDSLTRASREFVGIVIRLTEA